jgi:hypothetical protein
MYSIIHAFHIFSGLILGLPLFLATECRSCRPGKRAPLNRFWGQIRCRGTCGVNAQSTRCDRHFPVNWCGWLWTWVLKKKRFQTQFLCFDVFHIPSFATLLMYLTIFFTCRWCRSPAQLSENRLFRNPGLLQSNRQLLDDRYDYDCYWFHYKIFIL